MTRSKVTLNKAGIRKMLNSPEVVAVLEARGRSVLAAAKADTHDDTGDYERGLRMETQTGRTRARVKVVSGDWKGHILEAEYGILARALDAAGQ